MQVLGCAISEGLWQHLERHLAPPVQPFFVSGTVSGPLGALPHWTREEFRALGLPLTVTDMFTCYAVPPEVPRVLMLDEAIFMTLPHRTRALLLAEQARYGRGMVQRVNDWTVRLPDESRLLEAASEAGLFLWWPSLWAALSSESRMQVLLDFLTEDRLPHRGQELTRAHWAHIDSRLPGVRALAGTFAPESGANCFGSVVAAFGVSGVADLWLHGSPFIRWLEGVAVQTESVQFRALDHLGTVLVWRDEAGRIQHAAVALGDGWIFQKDAQNWYAPRQIVALTDLLSRWHHPGWKLSAYTPGHTGAAPRPGMHKTLAATLS